MIKFLELYTILSLQAIFSELINHVIGKTNYMVAKTLQGARILAFNGTKENSS